MATSDETNKFTKYNKEGVYTEKILPLVNQIKVICMKENIPFIYSFATENSEKKTTYENDALFPVPLGVNLTDDVFGKILLVLNGADVEPLCEPKMYDEGTYDYLAEADGEEGIREVDTEKVLKNE